MHGHSAQLVALGLSHLSPVIGRAGCQTLLSLSDAALRELSAACLEVAVVWIAEAQRGSAGSALGTCGRVSQRPLTGVKKRGEGP